MTLMLLTRDACAVDCCRECGRKAKKLARMDYDCHGMRLWFNICQQGRDLPMCNECLQELHDIVNFGYENTLGTYTQVKWGNVVENPLPKSMKEPVTRRLLA